MRGDRVNDVAALSRHDYPSHSLEARAVKRVARKLQPAGRKETKGVDRCLEHSKNMLNAFTARAQAW